MRRETAACEAGASGWTEREKQRLQEILRMNPDEVESLLHWVDLMRAENKNTVELRSLFPSSPKPA
jgi:hypothetical protein